MVDVGKRLKLHLRLKYRHVVYNGLNMLNWRCALLLTTKVVYSTPNPNPIPSHRISNRVRVYKTLLFKKMNFQL